MSKYIIEILQHQKHDHPTYTPQPPLGHHSHNHIGSHQSHRHSDNHIQVINHHSRDSILSPTPDQDPTNLYFANLPLGFREYDLEHMLLKYGHVVSTRIDLSINCEYLCVNSSIIIDKQQK